MLTRIRAGAVALTFAEHRTVRSLQRRGYPVEIVAETHSGEPCTPFAPPPGERWHWVARWTGDVTE
jgi:hypothetical protein